MAGPRGGDPGGSLALLELIEEHKAAFAYDWRTRFGLPLSAVGEAMTFGEALLLAGELAADPSSRVAAALSGWSRPADRVEIALADLFDLIARTVEWKKPPRDYPRAWDRESSMRSVPAAGVTQEDVVAALIRAGHRPPTDMEMEGRRV